MLKTTLRQLAFELVAVPNRFFFVGGLSLEVQLNYINLNLKRSANQVEICNIKVLIFLKMFQMLYWSFSKFDERLGMLIDF